MPQNRPSSVTLRQVADKAGVSAMTVSRSLSGKSNLVRSETAQRCRKIAQEMGYVPNLMARSLRGEHLSTIVMLAEFISAHHYLAELVDVVARSIERREYGVISCQSFTSFNQAIHNFKLAGAVVIAPPEDFYRQPFGDGSQSLSNHQPTVLIHSAVEQDRFNEVSPDITAFTYRAAVHLLELGHRRLGYLGGPRDEDEPRWFELRRRGVFKALAQHNLSADCLRYQPCPDVDKAAASLQQLLCRAPHTTGLICINDEIAIAATQGACEAGLRVPQNLSIVGCNNIRLAAFFRPALTSLKIDIHTMVETALDLLFEEIANRPNDAEPRPVKIKLPAELIIRDSTAPPPSSSGKA